MCCGSDLWRPNNTQLLVTSRDEAHTLHVWPSITCGAVAEFFRSSSSFKTLPAPNTIAVKRDTSNGDRIGDFAISLRRKRKPTPPPHISSAAANSPMRGSLVDAPVFLAREYSG